jgi:hypothetical protein
MNLSRSSRAARFLALFAAIFLPVSSATQNALADELTGLFSLRLEANKSVYQAGEDIELRLTVHNNTDKIYGVADAAPWRISKLIILNGQSQLLTPKTSPLTYSSGPGSYFWKLSPGMTQIWSFHDPNDYRIIKQWAELGYWGYQLTEPGTYTITAVPTMSGFQNAGPNFSTSGQDRSNTVEIEIRK